MQESLKEDDVTEFKQSLDEDNISKTITAFANGNGGQIYVGITDHGKVVGAKIGKNKLEQFTQSVHNATASPAVFDTRFEKSGSVEVLVIRVHPARRKPVFYKGAAYKRVNKTTMKITDPEELRSLFVNKTIFFDDAPCTAASLNDLDEESIRKFSALALAANRIPHPAKGADFLSKIGLIDDKSLKNAAVMLFGKKPSDFFPVWGIRCAVVSSSMEFEDLQDFNENLIQAIDQALKYILSKIPKEIKMEGLHRHETPRIPERAIREALVNAVAHRDYFFPSFVYVTIGPDYLEIKNPGRLEGLTIADLSKHHASVIKNPNIAKVFHLCKYIETWGSGTVKIYQAMREKGLKDPYFEMDSMFSVRLTTQPQKLNTRQKYILEAIQAGKSIKPTNVAAKYKISVTAALGDFSHLVHLGLLQKTGRGRSSTYKTPSTPNT